MTEQIDQARQALRLALPLLVSDRDALVEKYSPGAWGIPSTPSVSDADMLASYDTAIAACRQALGEDA